VGARWDALRIATTDAAATAAFRKVDAKYRWVRRGGSRGIIE
jgi:hypothetical protein